MDLSESLARYGAADFGEVLKQELARYRNQLPTEKACRAGGWPLEESITIHEIVNERETADAVLADVSVSFRESGNPACGGVLSDIHRMLDCRVVIDKKTGKGFVEAVDDDPPEEF